MRLFSLVCLSCSTYLSLRVGIPVASVGWLLCFFLVFHILYLITIMLSGNARALADEGQPATSRQSAPGPVDLPSPGFGTSPSSLQPPSPNPNPKRQSLTPAGTSKVLADLQTGVVNARNALENTKAQLRLSQRSVAQLTRQTEDLKEGRERLRLENEGLNNVVARKERLLQEVRYRPFIQEKSFLIWTLGTRTCPESRIGSRFT